MTERLAESSVIDRAALVDHYFAVANVAGDPAWQLDSEHATSDQAGRARKHPCGRMVYLIEKV